VLGDEERERLHANMAAAMVPCSVPVAERWLAVLERVDPRYAAGVRNQLDQLRQAYTRMSDPGIAAAE
jgi:catalase